jgi:hypothetical protein
MSETRKSAAVVAGWFAGNAVLAAILPAFNEDPFAIVLFAASTALPAATAVIVLGFAGRNPRAEQEFDLAGKAIWALPAALGLVLVGVGAIAGIWLTWIGGLMVVLSCIQLIRGSLPSARKEPVDAR